MDTVAVFPGSLEFALWDLRLLDLHCIQLHRLKQFSSTGYTMIQLF